MSERRGVLTVDLDCTRCGGTGRVQWREDRPGAVVRCGGGPVPHVRREGLCPCVRVDAIAAVLRLAGER